MKPEIYTLVFRKSMPKAGFSLNHALHKIISYNSLAADTSPPFSAWEY
jgi:hypothetical protein